MSARLNLAYLQAYLGDGKRRQNPVNPAQSSPGVCDSGVYMKMNLVINWFLVVCIFLQMLLY